MIYSYVTTWALGGAERKRSVRTKAEEEGTGSGMGKIFFLRICPLYSYHLAWLDR